MKHNEQKQYKKIIRLTESDLHDIIQESVKRMLSEEDEWDAYLQQDDDLPDNNNIHFGENDYETGYCKGIETAIQWIQQHMNDYTENEINVELITNDMIKDIQW